MNRTRKLMTYVTTSLLIAGAQNLALPNDSATTVSDQGSSPPDQGSKTNPKVRQAAQDIYEWLKATPKDQSKTADEIAQNFPTLQPRQVQDALAQLRLECRLRTTGFGTKDDPYRYFGASTGRSG